MFFDNLTKICNEQNIKITPLLKELDISTGSISRWKNGVVPNGETLIKLSKRLNCSVDYLLSINNTPTSIEKLLNKLKNGSSRGATVVFKDGDKHEVIDIENMTEEEFKKFDKVLDIYRNKD